MARLIAKKMNEEEMNPKKKHLIWVKYIDHYIVHE